MSSQEELGKEDFEAPGEEQCGQGDLVLSKRGREKLDRMLERIRDYSPKRRAKPAPSPKWEDLGEDFSSDDFVAPDPAVQDAQGDLVFSEQGLAKLDRNQARLQHDDEVSEDEEDPNAGMPWRHIPEGMEMTPEETHAMWERNADRARRRELIRLRSILPQTQET